ncbi:LysR family transcriptional regulator [Fodinicurvata halophila]|uniref:LysR family transcriptional regulator n=1 Tax=Fodinicurvata halophila TaxID=1419723 RepID=A0ABV8UIB2_9PROT
MDTAFTYFDKVSQLGSIRKAAETLNVSPSSVSRQIDKLEHMFEAPLIIRHAKGVKLTPEGEVLARFTRSRSRELHRVRASIDALKGLHRGHVTIYTVEGTIGWMLPQAIASFSKRHPQITYDVRVAGTDGVMAAIAEDMGDIGISFHPLPRSDVEVIASIVQPLLAVMSPSHPFAERRQVSLAELTDQPVALPDRSFGIRHLIDHASATEQLGINVRLETNSIDMLRQFVLQEMGIAFLPGFSFEQELISQRLVGVPIDDAILGQAKTQVCKHAEIDLTPAADGFVKTILETFAL